MATVAAEVDGNGVSELKLDSIIGLSGKFWS